MANKELTAKVKLDTSSAEAKLKRLNTLIKSINRAVTGHNNTSQLEAKLAKQVISAEKVKQATLKTQIAQEKVKQAVSKTAQEIGKEYITEERLNQTLLKTESIQKRIKDTTSQTASSTTILSKMFKTSNTHASSLLSTLKRLASTYLGIMGMRAMINTSDTLTGTQNKLNNLNGGDTTLTQNQMDKMYASANKVRMAYTDMAANASKSMTLAGGAFQGNMDNAIRFQEIMAKTYVLGGASAEEMSTSMYQMIQALGAGTLAGDELRSVREGAPLAYKAIEEFAQGVYNSKESLKDMASQGLITSEMVVAAVMDAGKKIDTQFDKTYWTFGQAWNRIKNAAVKAFEPVSNALRDMLNRAADNGAFEKIEQAFWSISKAIQIAFKIIENTITWLVDNWNWLKHVIIGALLAMIAYQIIKTGVSVYCAYMEMKAWMAANGVTWAAVGSLLTVLGVIAIILIAVLALAYVFILWKTGAIDTCQAIVAALLIVGVAILLIGLLTGNVVLIVIGIVIAAIALIINWLDYFLAIVYSVGAAIWNIVAGVVNAIIQFLWTYFVEPWIGIIEWVLNVFNGGFNSFGDAVKNLLGNIISWFLSLGQVVTKIIDAIFGTNWTGGLESLKGKLLSWGKNENAITLNREAPTVLNRISYTDAWNTGMSHGSTAQDWLAGLGSNSQGGGLDGLASKLGLNFSGMSDGFPSGSAYDTSGAYSMPENLKATADNTGDIADSMNLAEEDLEYLRKIADMEWKKEFTTANITVDMTNYNTVDGDGDLDGIVSKLSDKLREELNVVANGVYV